MITVTTAELNALLAAYLYPFVRILGLLATEPVLGNRSVPAQVKVGLAIAITVVLVPSLPPPPAVEPASGIGLLILGQQLLIGIALGFVMRIVFDAVEMAGQMIGLQMGLGFATFFDPQTAGQVPVVGQFLGITVLLVFLAINGHALVLSVLAESFRLLPVGQIGLGAGGFGFLASWGAQIFAIGLVLALPVIAALLVANAAFGLLTRAAPQINIFSVGFPFTLLAGFVALYLSMPHFMPVFDRLFASGIEAMVMVLRAFAS